jgi:glycosyltransferase involved in cell wall biosynthesis
MLIITSSLALAGSSTFILRISKQYFKNGKKIGVLLLWDDSEEFLKKELEKYAEVYYLNDYIKPGFRVLNRNISVSTMLPVNKKEFKKIISKFNTIHVLGMIGLMYSVVLIKKLSLDIGVTVGIYHQNEYLFDHADTYFIKKIWNVFSEIDSKNFIFFNEANKISYTKFFSKDFSNSKVLPIGIELPQLVNGAKNPIKFNRIVSIGNLYEFKTYNLHLINIFPELLKVRPDLKYEIYGEGALKAEMQIIVKELGLEDSVLFKGTINYNEFYKILSEALLFIGSGTSLLEAASYGVPSLTGIESSTSAVTYGFIGQIDGLSYNEKNLNLREYSLFEKIKTVIINVDEWKLISDLCFQKAKMFSIENTYQGFQEVNLNCKRIKESDLFIKDISVFRLLSSLFILSVKHVLGVDRTFSSRRNQGTIV